MKTRAVVIPQANQVELQDVTLKAIGADDVRIETAYTSISAGTERMLFTGQMPHPMLQLPVIPGYETVGRIAAIGSAVTTVQVGDWVYIGGAQCYDGINAAWGGQSAQIVVPAERVIALKGISPRVGVLLALAATALHGIDVVGVESGERVLVIGQGPVGQLAARIAKQRGAWVAVTDINPTRLAQSVADEIIDVSETAVTDALTEAVDSIIEASGSMQALAQAQSLLNNGGIIALLGYYQKLELPYMPLFLKEAKLLTAKEWAPGDLDRCRDMLADGSLDVASLLTHEYPIADIATAYETALNDQACLKLVLNWETS